ncbi:MAG: serine/threonine protein kinase [Firmicutes bacterium]|nr:serine/threonine protein kinase [Bacillota bacterium]
MTISELKSRFSSIERIKKGGQKVVYKATSHDGEIVALKIISNATDPRVLQEISLVKTLSMPCVPQIIESGLVTDEAVSEDALYIIEQYVDGLSLRDWINAKNSANLKFAYTLLEALLSAEIELENNQILHRDINPNNIILGEDGMIYLIDFGLAKIIGGSSLTQTAAAHGPFTPGYAPHEQFANIKLSQDVRTDLFQIGITVYECCVGSNPFVKPNETVFQIMSRTMTMMPPLLDLPGDTKGQFAQFVNMLMAKNQSQRPDTATDAMRYLKAIRSTLEMEG